MSSTPPTPAPPAPPPPSPPTEPPKGSGGGGILTLWSLVSIVVALVTDLIEPVGRFALGLLVVSAVLLVLSLVAMRAPKLRKAAGHGASISAMGVAVFGGIVALQQFATPGDSGKQRGVLASYVPVLAGAQERLLPMSPERRAELEFLSAISTGESADRTAAARTLLAAATNADVRRFMLERLLSSQDENLRRLGLIAALKARIGGPLPIVIVSRPDAGSLSLALTGQRLRIDRIDEETGALSVNFYYDGLGSVTRDAVVLSLPYPGSRGFGDRLEANLNLVEDFQLRGTLRSNSGATAEIELPLI